MKATVNHSEKIQHQSFGSIGAQCTLEFEVSGTPDEVLAMLRFQSAICEQHVHEQLDRHRPATTQPARNEPGDDVDDRDDIRPGDPAYERNRPPARADDRGSFNEFPDHDDDRGRTQDDGPQRGRGDRRDYTAPDRDRGRDGRHEPAQRRDDRRQGGGGQRDYGVPRNAKQVAGWFASLNDTDEGKELQKEAYRVLRGWGVGTIVKDLSNGDALDLYHTLTNGAASRNGGGWGGNDNGRNGDGRGRR